MEDVINWNSFNLYLDGLNLVMNLGYRGLLYCRSVYEQSTQFTINMAKELVYNKLSARARELEQIAQLRAVRRLTN